MPAKRPAITAKLLRNEINALEEDWMNFLGLSDEEGYSIELDIDECVSSKGKKTIFYDIVLKRFGKHNRTLTELWDVDEETGMSAAMELQTAVGGLSARECYWFLQGMKATLSLECELDTPNHYMIQQYNWYLRAKDDADLISKGHKGVQYHSLDEAHKYMHEYESRLWRSFQHSKLVRQMTARVNYDAWQARNRGERE